MANATEFAKCYLVDYSHHSESSAPVWFLRRLYKFFDAIFVISSAEEAFANNVADKVINSGDTKFDRVWERSQQKARTQLLAPYISHKRILLIGSAWDEDLVCVLDGLKRLSETQRDNIALVVVPHDLSPDNLRKLQNSTLARGFRYREFGGTPSALEKNEVLNINVMGHLSDLYSEAHCCFVGGAMHHRVHNVLEPAVYNLAIGFGPHYQTQSEARLLVDRGLAKVCKGPEDVAQWLATQLEADADPGTRHFVETQTGASDKVLSYALKDFAP
jgi:3-deoxy-D-manno-octulosonic-acid transferase